MPRDCGNFRGVHAGGTGPEDNGSGDGRGSWADGIRSAVSRPAMSLAEWPRLRSQCGETGEKHMRTPRPEPSGFAAKAKDLQALRGAVDDAATVSGALWITYLFVFLYLAIAAGAVT